MTLKQRREMQHLRNENEILQEKLGQQMRIYSGTLGELVKYKIALKDLHDMLVDGVFTANEALRKA